MLSWIQIFMHRQSLVLKKYSGLTDESCYTRENTCVEFMVKLGSKIDDLSSTWERYIYTSLRKIE